MKKQNLLTVLFLIITSSAFAQFPDGVNAIDAKPNEVTTFTGNLADGFMMEDLSWASTSSNACFPGTQNKKFRGKHVLHGLVIPPYSEVFIKVIPKDKNANYNIFIIDITCNYIYDL